MIFNRHSALSGQHALLSASKYHWINYDSERLIEYFNTSMAARRGTELHALAHDLIRLGVKLPRNTKTLNQYVNDAIGFRMNTEVTLFYSENAFGTADAISFDERKNFLRISDLKTGVVREASEKQLLVYAAFFCLEYGYRPFDISTELRIYQSDECRLYEADPDDVAHIMDRIITFDKYIAKLKEDL